MHSLFRVFSHIVLKATGIYVVVSLLGILALDKMFGGYEFYLGMLVFIGPLLGWWLTFMLVPKNLDWIMALPISKRNVLLLHYSTSVFTSVLVLVASLFVLVMLVLVKRDANVDVTQVARAAPAAMVPKDWFALILAGIDIYGWATGLLMLSFFHALSMSISRPVTTKRIYVNLWNHVSPALRWTIRMGWVGAIALAAVFRDFVLSPFGVFVLATSAFLLVTTFNTANALALPHKQRKRWLAVAAAMACVQIVFLFVHATNGVKSDKFDRRVASVMFLGPFSGGMARADLARLLEADINHERVDELGEMYRQRFWKKKRVRSSQDADLSFKRAIANKRTFQDVVSVVKLFEPSELEFSDLEALFTKLQPLLAECRCEFSGYELLAARASTEEIATFLQSKDDLAVQFALLWARYHAGKDAPRLARAIERRIPALGDELKLSALFTISVITGRRYNLDDWIKASQGQRSLASVFHAAPKIECERFAGKQLSELASRDAGAINYCVRHKAEVAFAAEIEAAGWLRPPFDVKSRATIRKILKLK